ncbi:MAG: hypothetical protein K2N51_09630 [Lachnospiraceae bacterium]|nr:hypothetical protein [Lachnospiraceae bacterium]
MEEQKKQEEKEKHERLMRVSDEIENCLKREKVSVADAEWIFWGFLNGYKQKMGKLKRVITVDELPKDEN